MERLSRQALWLLLLCMPLTVTAQRVTVTPVVGVYVPLKALDSWFQNHCDRPDCTLRSTSVRSIDNSSAFGVRVTMQGAGRTGLEASLLMAPTRLLTKDRFTEGTATAESTYSYVYRRAVLNTIGVMRFTVAQPLSPSTTLVLGAGASLTHLGGSGYADVSRRTLLGGSFSASLHVAPTPRTQLEVGLGHSMYAVRFTPGEGKAYMQHDIVLSAGYGFRLHP